MDQAKVRAILEWELPSKSDRVAILPRLANNYQRFILGYSTITIPLTNLLKKNYKWNWTVKYQEAFEELKKVVTT